MILCIFDFQNSLPASSAKYPSPAFRPLLFLLPLSHHSLYPDTHLSAQRVQTISFGHTLIKFEFRLSLRNSRVFFWKYRLLESIQQTLNRYKSIANRSLGETSFVPIGDRITPLNLCCSRSNETKRSLTSLRPEHFLGSQCPRSHIDMRHGKRGASTAAPPVFSESWPSTRPEKRAISFHIGK